MSEDIPEIECNYCGWQGDSTMLECAEDELGLPAHGCHFERCPECGSNNIDDFEETQDD